MRLVHFLSKVWLHVFVKHTLWERILVTADVESATISLKRWQAGRRDPDRTE